MTVILYWPPIGGQKNFGNFCNEFPLKKWILKIFLAKKARNWDLIGNTVKTARRAAENVGEIGSFLKFLNIIFILEIGVGGWVPERSYIVLYCKKGWVGGSKIWDFLIT